jgi:dienelactone hydrolase
MTRRPALLATLALIAGCDDGGAAATITMTAGEAAPAYGTTPFPTDAVRDGDRLGVIAGLDAVVGEHADLVAAHVATLDGFGLRPVVEMFVDGALDPASVPARTAALADPAVVIDIDPASPERGRVVAMDWRYLPGRGVLAGAPAGGDQLREGTRYAAVVTTGLLAADGSPVARAADLDAIVASATPPARWQSTAAAHAELDAMAPLAGRIAGLAVFTTEHATAPLVAARNVQADPVAVPAPTLTFSDPAVIFRGDARLDRLLGVATRATDGPRAGLERWGNDNPTGIAHDHVGVIGTGAMTVARFRGDDTGTDQPDDETFQLDPVTGAPRVIAIDSIPVTFALPAAPAPAAGYPVIILGHGLGNSRHHLLAFAEPLTAQGYALAIIDMAGHGSRFDPDDVRNNLATQIADFTGDPDLPDGFGDRTGPVSQFDFFEGFMNVAAVRDSIRQSALDLSRLTELLRQPDLDLTALRASGPRLDTTRIAYLGESFGTVVGTVFAAIEPDVDLFVLDVPGGGILDLLLPGSPAIGAQARPVIDAIYRPTGGLDRFDPLIGLMQAVLDGADPLSYAPHVLADRFTIDGAVLAPRSVVCIEVVGDEVLANTGTDALAVRLGLAVLSPHLEVPAGMPELASPASGNRDGQTAILVQYAPATHGANWSSERGELRYLPGFPAAGPEPFPELPAPISIANPLYETWDQVAEILSSHRAGEAPVVRSTLTPVHDFDGDGTPDDVDPDPLDPLR